MWWCHSLVRGTHSRWHKNGTVDTIIYISDHQQLQTVVTTKIYKEIEYSPWMYFYYTDKKLKDTMA